MPQQATQTAPAIAGRNVYTIPVADVPRTGEELQALQSRVEQMREQLQDAAARRNSVAENLRSADEQARQGYVDRLEVLDARILALETEISNSVARMAAAPVSARNAVAEQAPPDPAAIAANVVEDIVPIVAIISVFVLAPFAIAMSRYIWKRSTALAIKPAGPDRATQDRLEQLQQSMDAIAIEVERISEGQRFVTKIMSDRQVGSGAAEPVPVPKQQALRSEPR